MINAANPNMSKVFMLYHIIIHAICQAYKLYQKKSLKFLTVIMRLIYDHTLLEQSTELALVLFPDAMG